MKRLIFIATLFFATTVHAQPSIFPSSGGGGVNDSMTSLSDTVISGPTGGHIILWDGVDSWDNHAVSGDISLSAAGAAVILTDKILESHLKAIDAPVDEECLTYEATVGDFEWQPCASGSGDITAVGDCTTADCFAVTGTGNSLVFEGATVDSIETTLTAADPTGVDKTITMPNETGIICTTGSICSGYQASVAGGDAITLSGVTINFDGGAAPGGELGGTWASPTVNGGADTTAIHDNLASEISAITLKATPISGDFILIEDSAAGNAKRHITVGSLPAGSEVNDLSAAVTWANVPDANVIGSDERNEVCNTTSLSATCEINSSVIGRTEIDETLLSIQTHATDCTLLTCDATSDGEQCFQQNTNAVYTCDGSGTPAWTTPAVGGSQNLFETMNASSGTDPVADNATDTLAMTGTAPIVVTGDATTDTLTFSLTQNAGTDVTADLEEEVHASEHASGGSDPVDHDTLTNFVANEHIDHTGVTLTAGAGLSGGGDISANRTFTVASQEAGFLADGAAVDLTCGASNQGKSQVMDDGSIQYCDGATTSVLRKGFLDADGSDADTTYTGGDAITLGGTTFNFDGGATPAGELGGTWSSPTVDAGADGTALHDNVASEISAVALKATPVSADIILIEDSAAANAKKRITVGSLPAGAETNDLTAAVTWANVPDINVSGVNERDEVCGTTTLSTSCEINSGVVNQSHVDDTNTLTTDQLGANNCFWATTGLMCEGATDLDGFGTLITVADPTADRTFTIPDETGTAVTDATALAGDVTGTTGATALGANTVGASELRDSECTGSKIWKCSSGSWGLGDDLTGTPTAIALDLWVSTTGNDANNCTISDTCATLARAIAVAKSDGPPSTTRLYRINVAPGLYTEKNITMGSWITVQGGSPKNTIISGVIDGSEFMVDMTGVENSAFFDIAFKANAGSCDPSACDYGMFMSRGGTHGIRYFNFELTGTSPKTTMVSYEGVGNVTNWFRNFTPFNVSNAEEGRMLDMAGGGTATTGFCTGNGFDGGCVNNADCGGFCDSSSTNAGTLCAANADCTGGGACTLNGQCRFSSSDFILERSFIQAEKTALVIEPPSVCEGGATSLTGTVAVTLNSRTVTGTTTAFDTEVVVGERIIANGEERTVATVDSATSLTTTTGWSATASSLSATISNDGWGCHANADCDTGGTCTAGSNGGNFNIRMEDNIWQIGGGEGGECSDDLTNDCSVNADCTAGTCENYAFRMSGTNGNVIISRDVFTCLDEVGSGCVEPTYHLGALDGTAIDTAGVIYKRILTNETVSGEINPISDASYKELHLGDRTAADICVTLHDDTAAGSEGQMCYNNTNDEIEFKNKNVKVGNNLTVAGTGTITGAATMSSTLGVTGAATLSNTLGVTGAATLSSTLNVTGASTLGGLTVTTANPVIRVAQPTLTGQNGGGSNVWDIVGDLTTNNLLFRTRVADKSIILRTSANVTMLDCDDANGDKCNFPQGIQVAGVNLRAIKSECAVIEQLAAADDNFPIWAAPGTAVTVTGMGCKCDYGDPAVTSTCSGTRASIRTEDGSGNTTLPTSISCGAVGSNITYTAITTGGGLVAGEGLRIDVTNTPTDNATDTYTVCWQYTID